MLAGQSIDPTRKPLTVKQTELYKALEKARRQQERDAEKLAEANAKLDPLREKLASADQAVQDAALALAKALKDSGHRSTPTGEVLEVSLEYKPAGRSFVQPSWRVQKAQTVYRLQIGDGKEAVKIKLCEIDEEATAKLGAAPKIPPVVAPTATAPKTKKPAKRKK